MILSKKRDKRVTIARYLQPRKQQLFHKHFRCCCSYGCCRLAICQTPKGKGEGHREKILKIIIIPFASFPKLLFRLLIKRISCGNNNNNKINRLETITLKNFGAFFWCALYYHHFITGIFCVCLYSSRAIIDDTEIQQTLQ